MAKSEKHSEVKAGDTVTIGGHEAGVVAAVEQVSGCVVCGQYGGLVPVAGSASAHEACAAARPDVIAKVKARA